MCRHLQSSHCGVQTRSLKICAALHIYTKIVCTPNASPNRSRATWPSRDRRTTKTVTHMVAATHNQGPLASFAPARFVQVRARLLLHEAARLLHGRRNRRGRGCLQRTDRPHTHLQPKEVVEEPLGGALRQARRPGTQRANRLGPWTPIPLGTPAGHAAWVASPQPGQDNRCHWYSVTTGQIGGSSHT